MDQSAFRSRIILVDDHPAIVSALECAILRHSDVSQDRDSFLQVEQTNNLAEAVLVANRCPENCVVVLDLHLDGGRLDVDDGMQTLTRFREQCPDIPFLVYSGDDSRELVVLAYELGARAFVPKSYGADEVIEALKNVVQNRNYIPEKIELLLKAATSEESSRDVYMFLSPRQRDVLRHLLKGYANKVIAGKLGIAEGTVKAHLNGVYRCLRVHNRVQAIIWANAANMPDLY